MLPLPRPAPTTAERVASACVRAGGALLALQANGISAGANRQGLHAPVVTPVHHLMRDGSFALALPADRDHAAARSVSGSQALLELTDYAPLPLREPVRSLVWVRGPVREVRPVAIARTLDAIAAEWPDPALLHIDTPNCAPADPDEPRYTLIVLKIESVVVTDAVGAEPVSVADLLAARPDPFCEVESSLLWQLDTTHNDVLARLVARLPAQLRRGQVRPLGLDRYGLRFRVEGDEADHDVEMPFHKPVDDMVGLRQAIRVLTGCPFSNGLRARR